MTQDRRPGAANPEAASDLVGTEVTTRIAPTSDIETQLAEYRQWLSDHHDDPALRAGCLRLARILGGAR